MDFAIPSELNKDIERFKAFLDTHLIPNLSQWYRQGAADPEFYQKLGQEQWLGYKMENNQLTRHSYLREALIHEELAKISPGMAVTTLVVSDLGIVGLYLFGTPYLQATYGTAVTSGRTLICLGNTENHAGSDVANITATAEKTDDGWLLNGTKAYVTNGSISDFAVITAITDSQAPRNQRLSMFLVNLNQSGVLRKKLNKQVWIPSDLTRIQLTNVHVPDTHLMGKRGQGLQQVLAIFNCSRVVISALTLGTAEGAFDLAMKHACKRRIFNKRIVDFQAKAFEAADYCAKIEAARLLLHKACWLADHDKNFRIEASMAKYLSVEIARAVSMWAADLYGAASVVYTHPIHKFPLDAWGSSLGEGTQDVQKLVIFREMMRQRFAQFS
jgi:alkylation response protein AidB-like acyl-CoA dehydrogenase